MGKDLLSDLHILAYLCVKELTNEKLLCFIRSESREVRQLVIQQFHTRPSHEVFDIAVSLIAQKDARSREAGYLILGQLGAGGNEKTPCRPFKEQSMPYLIKGLESEKKTSVKSAIACAIGHLNPPTSTHLKIVERLSCYFDKGSESLRISIAFAVGGLSASKQLDLLLNKLLNDESQEVREWTELSVEFINNRRCGVPA